MSDFVVRRAKTEDAAVVAHHRARMFYDMGDVSDALFDEFRERAERWLIEAIQKAEYAGWLAAEARAPEKILAGAGAQLRQVAPHPARKANGDMTIGQGRQAIVINVYTEPEWRRRGLAEMLMREILDWARMERLDRLLLHASKFGRGLYERLGFVGTNEMRYSAPLFEEK